MSNGNTPITRGIAIAKVVTTIATSTAGQPQSPVTQFGTYQRARNADTSQQINTGRRTNQSSGNK